MKEAEAKEKTCPFGIAPLCLARGCMAWVPLRALALQESVKDCVDEDGTMRPITPEDGHCVRVREILGMQERSK